jgi:hypothetical protein
MRRSPRRRPPPYCEDTEQVGDINSACHFISLHRNQEMSARRDRDMRSANRGLLLLARPVDISHRRLGIGEHRLGVLVRCLHDLNHQRIAAGRH